MASAVVVLIHETSTLRQSQFYINWFKFSVGDYVREVTSPAKFGSDAISGRAATSGQHIRVLWLYFILFFYLTELQPIPVNQFLHTLAQKTRSSVRMTSFPVGNKTSLSWKPCIPIKSYYGTLSGSHGLSFRIRHEKSPEAPPGGEITMTSYPVSNNTSLCSEAMHPR